MSALGLLLMGATIALHVESVGAVAPETRRGMADELTAAIEAQTGQRVVLDEDDASCAAGEPCLSAIRSRAATIDVVLVRLIAGPLRLRVSAERQGAGPADARRFDVDVKKGAPIGDGAAELARALFPAGRSLAEPPPILRVEAERSRLPSLVAWGAAAALVGTGVAFGLSSRSALDTLGATGGVDEASTIALGAEARRGAIVADLSFILAASAAAAGIVLWVWP